MTEVYCVPVAINADIDVLREMVRLAENRRAEMLDAIEKVNKYNLALIAFSAGFLSLLVTVSFNIFIVRLAGGLLLLSIIFSLFAVRPKRIRGVTLMINDDVDLLKQGIEMDLKEYLLAVAELTDVAASTLNNRAKEKKTLTILSAISLALALSSSYILYAYA
jgi:hypothetical protein